MASVPCSSHMQLRSRLSGASVLPCRLKSPFLASSRTLGWLGSSNLRGAARRCSSHRGGATCFFRFGKNGMDAEGAGIYGSQCRDDFDCDDVEQYFNYMGMLAVEGSYDTMNALLEQDIHPVDILLLLAATEGDKPKIEELMRAGAKCDVKDVNGRTALDRACSDEIRDLILNFSVQNV